MLCFSGFYFPGSLPMTGFPELNLTLFPLHPTWRTTMSWFRLIILNSLIMFSSCLHNIFKPKREHVPHPEIIRSLWLAGVGVTGASSSRKQGGTNFQDTRLPLICLHPHLYELWPPPLPRNRSDSTIDLPTHGLLQTVRWCLKLFSRCSNVIKDRGT